jgi:hypothetical protein
MKRAGLWLVLVGVITGAVWLAVRVQTKDAEQEIQAPPASPESVMTIAGAARATNDVSSVRSGELPTNTTQTSQIRPLTNRASTVVTVSTQAAPAATRSPVARRNSVSSSAAPRPGLPMTSDPAERPFDPEVVEREILGIGAVLMRAEDGALRVRGTVPGSPAAFASIDGCTIQSIDGVNVTSVPLADCVRMIRGPAGTTVRLEVLDPSQKLMSVDIVRQRVQL